MRFSTLFLLCSALLFAQSAEAELHNAESPPEKLHRLAGQLRKSPGDDILRREIILQAKALMLAPRIPDEAHKALAAGDAKMRSAASAAEKLAAIDSFKKALTIAPWWGDAYYKLAMAEESAGQAEAARQSFQFFLLTGPNAVLKQQAKKHVDKLEHKQKVLVQEQKIEKKTRDADTVFAQIRQFNVIQVCLPKGAKSSNGGCTRQEANGDKWKTLATFSRWGSTTDLPTQFPRLVREWNLNTALIASERKIQFYSRAPARHGTAVPALIVGYVEGEKLQDIRWGCQAYDNHRLHAWQPAWSQISPGGGIKISCDHTGQSSKGDRSVYFYLRTQLAPGRQTVK